MSDEPWGGQHQPCMSEGGQSLGVWIYCDLPTGHTGPHWGWCAMHRTSLDDPMRDRTVTGDRTHWEDE